MLKTLLLVLPFSTAATCLPDAIPISKRKLVGADQSDQYPIGIWRNAWPAGDAMAEMVAIIIEEMLGYAIEFKGPGPDTPTGFYALAGCLDPTNATNQQCEGATRTSVHVNVEVWTGGYPLLWQKIQDDYPALAPQNLGSAGYDGSAGTFVPSFIQEEAFNAEGLSLDFYREHDVRWNDPSKYFANFASVNTSRLFTCNETHLHDDQQMATYLAATADDDGLVLEGQKLVGKCWHLHFWFSPQCRKDESRCFLWLTAKTGWALQEHMQKATAFNMAMAMAVAASWNDYTSLPQQLKGLFYWWVPDTTFLRMSPVQVLFPEHDALAWQAGDFTSGTEKIPIDKHVSKDLSYLAPLVVAFMTSLNIGIKDVNSILLDAMNSTAKEAVCQWMQTYPERWRPWLPDSSKCVAGFGMYDKAIDEGFEIRNRSASAAQIVCRACPSGRFSDFWKDERGSSYVCQPCPPGQSQALGAAQSCDPCPAGHYQGLEGSQSCLRCDRGAYQDTTGQSSCKLCPGGTTTAGLGSIARSECACNAGTILRNAVAESDDSNVAGEVSVADCELCGEGLTCPLGASIESLTQGSSMLGPDFITKVKPGYVAHIEAGRVDVFKCTPASHCPGGTVASCAGGLQGRLCTRCGSGEAWDGTSCKTCKPELVTVLWILVVGVFGLVLKAYDFVNLPASHQASGLQTGLIFVTLLAHAAQTVALFGMMIVSWPITFSQTSETMQFLVFDISSSPLTCLTGWEEFGRFAVSALLFPFLTMCFLGRWIVSRTLPKNRYISRWVFPHTFNTAATILQAAFATVASIALQPLMCYRHPNGTFSVLKYPNIVCGSYEQITMVLLGIVLMALAVAFFVLCSLAAYQIPAWSVQKESWKVQVFRFLTGKFRADVWWFGIIHMVRAFAITMVITIATNLQRAQSTLVAAILAIYLAFQAAFWPWKGFSLNMSDIIINTLLLLLITQSSQEATPADEEFTMIATLVIMVLLACCFGYLLVFSLYKLIMDGYFPASTQWDQGRTEQVSEALKSCAEQLMVIECHEIDGTLKKLNQYDIQALEKAITLISMELQDGRWAHFKPRVSLGAMNATMRATLIESEDVHTPGPKVADPTTGASDMIDSDVGPGLPRVGDSTGASNMIDSELLDIGARITPGDLISHAI